MQGLDRLKKRLDAMLPQPNKAAACAALKAIELIRTRTQKGFDANGRRFKGYAKTTREMRKARGREVSHVDLVDTGSMLSAITYKGSGSRAIIHFANALENRKAAGHQFGKKRLPKRPFFGFTKGERKEIADIVIRGVRGNR